VEEDLLRHISGCTAPAEKIFLKYTLIPKKGGKLTMSVSAAEIKALLKKTYEYCQEKKYPCKRKKVVSR
jgi:hypothetical protein